MHVDRTVVAQLSGKAYRKLSIDNKIGLSIAEAQIDRLPWFFSYITKSIGDHDDLLFLADHL